MIFSARQMKCGALCVAKAVNRLALFAPLAPVPCFTVEVAGVSARKGIIATAINV